MSRYLILLVLFNSIWALPATLDTSAQLDTLHRISSPDSIVHRDSLLQIDSLKVVADTALLTDSIQSLKAPSVRSWLPRDTNWVIPSLSINQLEGRFNPEKTNGFVKLPKNLTDGNKIYWLRSPAARSLARLLAAAAKSGLKIQVVSATRNFAQQKAIWEKKWNGSNEGLKYSDIKEPLQRVQAIAKFSAMPGASRHHWGTDVDLQSVNPNYFKSGQGLRIYKWLRKNAGKYGFCQVYAGKSQGRPGYEDEAWHWSFVPMSRSFLYQYLQKINTKIPQDFSGAQSLTADVLLHQYVEGIASECK